MGSQPDGRWRRIQWGTNGRIGSVKMWGGRPIRWDSACILPTEGRLSIHTAHVHSQDTELFPRPCRSPSHRRWGGPTEQRIAERPSYPLRGTQVPDGPSSAAVDCLARCSGWQHGQRREHRPVRLRIYGRHHVRRQLRHWDGGQCLPQWGQVDHDRASDGRPARPGQ